MRTCIYFIIVLQQSIEKAVMELEKKQVQIKAKIEELNKNSFALMTRVLQVRKKKDKEKENVKIIFFFEKTLLPACMLLCRL